MATSRIANNTLFMNTGAYKTFVQREKDDVKEFSRIAADTARTFENNSREFAQIIHQHKDRKELRPVRTPAHFCIIIQIACLHKDNLRVNYSSV